MARVVNNPHWTLFAENGVLLLSGGADELYVVDEAGGTECIERLLAAWQADTLGLLLQDPVCGAAVRQLQRMGVLVPATAMPSVQQLALSWLGEPLPELLAALQRQSRSAAGIAFCANPADAGLLVLIRSNASWQESLRRYQENVPRLPHLLIDLACHHTLSVGPYVVPGDSACVACLGHRITHRWGDMPLPPQPLASTQHELIAALILQACGNPLPYLERVVGLDLRTLDSRNERVFRLPKCEVCHGDNALNAEGFLPLPWAN